MVLCQDSVWFLICSCYYRAHLEFNIQGIVNDFPNFLSFFFFFCFSFSFFFFNFSWQPFTCMSKIIVPELEPVRLKKINAMSQSSWQIGRPDLNAVFLNFFFFFFSWAADVSDLSLSQLWNMELDFWMSKIQDRTQSWRSLLFKVFHCVCHIFSCIFCGIFWQESS